ncbi:hypothetical protein GCM10020254_83020 [Streptomyces goshikiensis]
MRARAARNAASMLSGVSYFAASGVEPVRVAVALLASRPEHDVQVAQRRHEPADGLRCDPVLGRHVLLADRKRPPKSLRETRYWRNLTADPDSGRAQMRSATIGDMTLAMRQPSS